MLVSILEVFSQKLRILLDGTHIVSSGIKDNHVLREMVVRLGFLLSKGGEVIVKSFQMFL
jgi:hypothetical protein